MSLEGAELPFVVWTDHKNQQYIQQAKRLNLDFITGLPASDGNTVILVVVDRFSNAAHFVALPKLPSVAETARLLVDHVFKLHGLPQDVVSNCGPQFTSQFWRAFCSLLGASG